LYAAASPIPHRRITPQESRIRADRQHWLPVRRAILDSGDPDAATRAREMGQGRPGAIYDTLEYDPIDMEIDAAFAVYREIGWNQPDHVHQAIFEMYPEFARFKEWETRERARRGMEIPQSSGSRSPGVDAGVRRWIAGLGSQSSGDDINFRHLYRQTPWYMEYLEWREQQPLGADISTDAFFRQRDTD
jgi:hypothetical protein